MTACLLAFVGALCTETIYALNVSFISAGRRRLAALTAGCWGVAFLCGFGQATHGLAPAGCWVFGLALGSYIGTRTP